MKTKLIGSIVAISLGLTGLSAAPAQAGNDDLAKILAGAATLFIIAKVANSKSDRDVSARNNRSGNIQNYRYYEHKERYNNRKARRKLLPSECGYRIRTRKGPQRVFGAACLRKNYRAAKNLPAQCKDIVRTSNGKRRVYGARCLRDFGYRVEARRY